MPPSLSELERDYRKSLEIKTRVIPHCFVDKRKGRTLADAPRL